MQGQQRRLFFSLCVTIGALVVLAAGLPQLVFRPGRPFALPAAPEAAGAPPALPQLGADSFWRVVLPLIFMALLVSLVFGLIFSARLRRELLLRLVGMITALLFIYLMVGLLRRMPPQFEQALSASGQPAAQAAGAEQLPAFVAQPPQWLVLVVSLAVIALLSGGIWLLWRRRHEPENPLVAPAARALASIEAGDDLRDTVLRCYLEMSRLLSEQRGIVRQQAVTPREFEQQLMAAGLRDGHIQQLTRLFEGVRYGARRATQRDERAAVDCLTAIVETYGRSS